MSPQALDRQPTIRHSRARPKTSRHFYSSLQIRHGASVKTVQARLGHKSATETLDTYGHLWPDADEQTRNILNESLIGLRKADSKLGVQIKT